jgi:hypothetical protein
VNAPLPAHVFFRFLIELGFAAFGAEVNRLAFEVAGGSGFLGINRHLTNRVDNLHKTLLASQPTILPFPTFFRDSIYKE